MSRILWYMFILAFILIIAAYWAGVNTEAKTFFAGVNSLVLSLTGRGANGQFAQYPTTPKGV